MEELVFDEPIVVYVGHKAYEVSKFIKHHPGGASSILDKKSTDVTRDYNFHSKKGREVWRRFRSPQYDKSYRVNERCAIL